MIRVKDGKTIVNEPCGECHLQPGEVCDICGASNGPPRDRPLFEGMTVRSGAVLYFKMLLTILAIVAIIGSIFFWRVSCPSL